MNSLSNSISIFFIAITLVTAWQFYDASKRSRAAGAVILLWVIFQGVVGLSGFYQGAQTTPPKFVILIAPGLILSGLLFVSKSGRRFIDRLDVRKLTILHAVRIPVEIILYFVCAAGLIPEIMTFEGNNYDILSGLTAPLMYYLVFTRKRLGYKALLAWNFGCLALLINILVIAILAAETPSRTVPSR